MLPCIISGFPPPLPKREELISFEAFCISIFLEPATYIYPSSSPPEKAAQTPEHKETPLLTIFLRESKSNPLTKTHIFPSVFFKEAAIISAISFFCALNICLHSRSSPSVRDTAKAVSFGFDDKRDDISSLISYFFITSSSASRPHKTASLVPPLYFWLSIIFMMPISPVRSTCWAQQAQTS